MLAVVIPSDSYTAIASSMSGLSFMHVSPPCCRSSSIFRTAFLVTLVSYILIGVILTSFFGDRIDQQCNLNWGDYVGCLAPAHHGNVSSILSYGADPAAWLDSTAAQTASEGATASAWASLGWFQKLSSAAMAGGRRLDAESPVDVDSRPGYATFVAFAVLIFPALDVLSAFPLNAITLGNNMLSVYEMRRSTQLRVAAKAAADARQPAAGATSIPAAHHDSRRSSIGGDQSGSELDAQPGQFLRKGSNSMAAVGHEGSVQVDEVNGSGAAQPAQNKPRTRSGYAAMPDDDAVEGGEAPHNESDVVYVAPRTVKIMFRLLAAIPPIVGASFVSDLGAILQFSGTVGTWW